VYSAPASTVERSTTPAFCPVFTLNSGIYLPGGTLRNSNEPSGLNGAESASMGPDSKQHSWMRSALTGAPELSVTTPTTLVEDGERAGVSRATRISTTTDFPPSSLRVSLVRSVAPLVIDRSSYPSGNVRR
jgi:hypothetical protein